MGVFRLEVTAVFFLSEQMVLSAGTSTEQMDSRAERSDFFLVEEKHAKKIRLIGGKLRRTERTVLSLGVKWAFLNIDSNVSWYLT